MAENWEKATKKDQEGNSYVDTPFKKPLRKSSFPSREEDLKYLGKNEDELVRIKYLTEEKHASTFTLEEFKRAKVLFKKLQEEYGINMPKMTMVAGNERTNNLKLRFDKMFTIVDFIYGKTFNKIEKLPAEAKSKVDLFFLGLLRHYYDTYLRGGDYWTDFKLDNMMYGHKKGETEDRVYLFDPDPYLHAYDPKRSIDSYGNLHLMTMLSVVGLSLGIVEKKFESTVKLEKSRTFFAEMLENMKMPPESKLYLKNSFEHAN